MKKLLHKKSLNILIVILIVALSFFFRIVALDVSPPGFNADEAALGYNAYSILKTGKDEWGQSFPLVFKSFSDYKPGVYVYLDIPFIALFGLNELAVRLPSIILGTFSVFLIYLLSKRLFKNELVADVTAFLLAISPWHLHYSRGAWETNIATFFVLLGVLTFLYGLKNYKWFYLSSIAFVLSMYSYQSTRLVVPSLLLLLGIFYWKKLFNKKIIGPIVIGVLALLPLAYILTTNAGLARFQGVSIFTDIGPGVRANEDRGQDGNPNALESKIFHNKYFAYGTNFLSHYLDHYNLNFLFINGDPLARNKVPDMGELYLFEILSVVLGFYVMVRNKFPDSKLVIIWLLVAPLAAALTYQTPHALRAENMVMPLVLISGLGLGVTIQFFWYLKKWIKFPILGISFIVITYFIVRFFHQYFIHLPKTYPLEWEYGFKELVPYVFSQKDNYEKVVVTDKYDQAYILFLFYSGYDPAKYQGSAASTGVDKFGFSTITGFDKFEFRSIPKEEPMFTEGILYAGTDMEIDNYNPRINVMKIINYPNGNPAFEIAQ